MSRTVFCERCGSRVGPDAKFCGRCGSPQNGAPQPMSPPPEATSPIQPGTRSQQAAPRSSTSPGARRNRARLLVGCGLLAVLVVVSVAFVLLHGNSSYDQLVTVLPKEVRGGCDEPGHKGSPPRDIVAEADCGRGQESIFYISYDTAQDAQAALSHPLEASRECDGSTLDTATLQAIAGYESNSSYPGLTCGVYDYQTTTPSPTLDWALGRVLVEYDGPLSLWPGVAALNVRTMRAEHLL